MIGVLGGGAFGTALAIQEARAGRDTLLWARDHLAVQAMQDKRRNEAYLPGVEFPEALRVTSRVEEVMARDIIISALPAQATYEFFKSHQAFAPLPVIITAKGVDLNHKALLGDLLGAIGFSSLAVLSGPAFATDLAQGLPTAMTFAGDEALQRAISTKTMRLYRSDDLIGVQLAGALKNVIAIACGIAIGGGYGESARAALMTRGYAEMKRFCVAYGGQAETLSGLAGFGDLTLTCSSPKSRNFRYGLAIGAGDLPETITTEGLATARAVFEMATEAKIEMPITEMVVALLDGQLKTEKAVAELLSRPLKEE